MEARNHGLYKRIRNCLQGSEDNHGNSVMTVITRANNECIFSQVINFYSLLYFLANHITSWHREPLAISLAKTSLVFSTNPRIHYRTHKVLMLGPVLRWFEPFHKFTVSFIIRLSLLFVLDFSSLRVTCWVMEQPYLWRVWSSGM